MLVKDSERKNKMLVKILEKDLENISAGNNGGALIALKNFASCFKFHKFLMEPKKLAVLLEYIVGAIEHPTVTDIAIAEDAMEEIQQTAVKPYVIYDSVYESSDFTQNLFD